MSLTIPSSRESSQAPTRCITEAQLLMENSLHSLVQNHWLVCLTSSEVKSLQEQFQPTIETLSENPALFEIYTAYRNALSYADPRSPQRRASYHEILLLIQQHRLHSSSLLDALIELNQMNYQSELYPSAQMTVALSTYRSAMCNLEKEQQLIAAQKEIS